MMKTYGKLFSMAAMLLLAVSAAWASDDAAYISDTIPTAMTVRTNYTPTVTMQNTGDTTWEDGTGVDDYNFGAPDISPYNEAINWGPGIDAGGVAPGATKVFTLNLTPTTPGTYYCTWKMLHGASTTGFGDACTKTITVSCGTPSADVIWGAETFDSYAAGTLNPQGPPAGTNFGPWSVQQGTNTDQVTVVGGGVTGNAAQIWHKSGSSGVNVTNGAFNLSWHIDEAPYIKKIKLSFKFRPLTGAGDDFWQLTFRDWPDTTARCYGLIQGSDTGIKAFDTTEGVKTGAGSTTQSVTNAWHRVDMIVDYKGPMTSNIVYYYMDGNFFYQGASDGGYLNANRVRAVDLIQLAGSANEMKVLIDDIKLSSARLPVNVITMPTSNYQFMTPTPTIIWARTWDPCDVAATQVRICASNDVNSTPVWDSGDVAGSQHYMTTGNLTNNAGLWVFERDKLTSGGYNPWTAGVRFTAGECWPPHASVISPSGTICTPKPTVTVCADPHTFLQVKVTSDSAGSNIVFDSGVINTTGNSWSCPSLHNGSYYAFARAGGPCGWNGWSSPSGFTVASNPQNQTIDIRHMNEAHILNTDTCWPNDGFGRDMFPTYIDGEGIGWPAASQTEPVCGNQTLIWNDRGPEKSLRIHKLGCDTVLNNVNLDNGVTFAYAVAIRSEGGTDGPGASWRNATAILADKDASGETYFVAIRTLPSGIGLISDTAAGNEAFGAGFSHHWAAWTPSTDYRIIRLTGRNAIVGDYSSTVWNVYVNENPTPIITASGTMTGSVMETDVATRNQIFPTDEIAIGHGSSGSTGVIEYDWTAVNCACDLAPGEWDPFGPGVFAGIGAAKSPGVEPRFVSIDGPMVVTKVVGSNSDEIGIPEFWPIDYYYVQDIRNNVLLAGLRVVPQGQQYIDEIPPGTEINHISGLMTESSGCRSISNASVTIAGGQMIVRPTAMNHNSMAGPCIDQAFGRSADSTGMFVRVFGSVPTAATFDPAYGASGGFIVYVDDGCKVIDPRAPRIFGGDLMPGIRVVLDAADPCIVVPGMGDYVMIDGIAGYDSVAQQEGCDYHARAIMSPVLTILGHQESSWPN
jgi:hypothetical protein